MDLSGKARQIETVGGQARALERQAHRRRPAARPAELDAVGVPGLEFSRVSGARGEEGQAPRLPAEEEDLSEATGHLDGKDLAGGCRRDSRLTAGSPPGEAEARLLEPLPGRRQGGEGNAEAVQGKRAEAPRGTEVPWGTEAPTFDAGSGEGCGEARGGARRVTAPGEEKEG